MIDDGRWLAGLALGALAVAGVASGSREQDLVTIGSWPRTPDFDPDDTGIAAHPLLPGSRSVVRLARRPHRAPLGLPRARIGFSPNGVRQVLVGRRGTDGSWYSLVGYSRGDMPSNRWYTLVDIRRVGEPEDLEEAVRLFEEEMPSIIRDLFGITLGPEDLLRVLRVKSGGAYGKSRKPLHVQQMAILLGVFAVGAWQDPLGTGKPRGRTWPPIVGHDYDDPAVVAQCERFEAVAERLRKLGFGV